MTTLQHLHSIATNLVKLYSPGTEAHTAGIEILEMFKPEPVKFEDVPLGAHFTYPGNDEQVLVLLETRRYLGDPNLHGTTTEVPQNCAKAKHCFQSLYSHIPGDEDCPNVVNVIKI